MSNTTEIVNEYRLRGLSSVIPIIKGLTGAQKAALAAKARKLRCDQLAGLIERNSPLTRG
jgi:hypothetical protein